MKSDLKRILESKQAHREDLAGRPVAEKLAMLDALRERALAIRASRSGEAMSSPEGLQTPRK
jgi:hypothetical protein